MPQQVDPLKRDGFPTFRLMSDGKWLKSKPYGTWKLAKLKAEVLLDPEGFFIAKGYTKTTY